MGRSLHKNFHLMLEFLKGPQEFDLWDTVDWSRMWLVDFNAGKNLAGFVWLVAVLMWRWVGLFLRKNHLFKLLRLIFSSKLDWFSCIISITKTAFKKIGVLTRSMKFLSPKPALYLYKSTIHPCMKHGILLLHLGWCTYLLLGIVKQATKTDMQECWSFPCYLSSTISSSSKCSIVWKIMNRSNKSASWNDKLDLEV